VIILLWRIVDIWDWFWYYRRGKVRYHVFDFGNTYNVFASNGKLSVSNCYGSTPEAAKEMALYRLKEALAEEPKEKALVLKGDGYTLFQTKE
jgi:hypothetical protein